METIAKIQKRGNKFVILSKDGKKLGEEESRDAAEKRLRQIEFFKKKGTSNMNGMLAGRPDIRVIDSKDHFPINDETQAQSAVLRASRVIDAPDWFNGNAEDLRQGVLLAVALRFPNLRVSAKITAHELFSITDAGEFSEHVNVKIKNPNANPPKVPEVPTPTIAKEDEKKKKKKPSPLYAGDINEVMLVREESLKEAKKLAERLTKKGVTPEEFNELVTFLQEDILHSIMRKGASASRRSALDKMVRATEKLTNPFRQPRKPTDGDKDKKKKG